MRLLCLRYPTIMLVINSIRYVDITCKDTQKFRNAKRVVRKVLIMVARGGFIVIDEISPYEQLLIRANGRKVADASLSHEITLSAR